MTQNNIHSQKTAPMRGKHDVTLTREELTEVDDWRFSNRQNSRAAAIRNLIKKGLASSCAKLKA